MPLITEHGAARAARGPGLAHKVAQNFSEPEFLYSKRRTEPGVIIITLIPYSNCLAGLRTSNYQTSKTEKKMLLRHTFFIGIA